MPKNTAVPSAWRSSAPAPIAQTSGVTPRMKANEVIRIGRSRSRVASTAASHRLRPMSSSCRANSTIRMAFLAASPISTTKPTWVRMLLSCPRKMTPVMAATRHIGTIRITASGSVRLSYCAASTRNTNTTASTKANMAVLPALICWNASEVHSVAKPSGSDSAASLSMIAIPCPCE